MFSALGRFAFRYRWPIIAVWVVLFILAGIFAPRVGSVLKSSFGKTNTESTIASDILERDLGLPPTTVVVVYSSDTLNVDDPQFKKEVEDSLAGLKSLPDLSQITTYYSSSDAAMVSKDRGTTYAVVGLSTPSVDSIDRAPAVEAKISPPPSIKMWVTGAGPIFSELTRASERDLVRAESYTLPLVAVALVLIFGSLVAAGLPILIGGISLVMTFAALFFIGSLTEMSVFARNTASLLGLGIAIDYSLFLVSRYREESAKRSREDALAVTLSTAGRAVFFSGLTTILGLAGLLMFKFTTLRSLGIGGIVVVFLSLMLAMTLLPAVIAVLGPRVDALTMPFLRRRNPGRSGFWQGLATWVMKHPVLVAVPVIAVLVFLASPVLKINLGGVWASALPKNSEARVGWDVAAEKFGESQLAPITITVTSKDGVLSPGNVAALYDYTHAIAKLPHVTGVQSIVDLRPDITREQYKFLYSPASSIAPPAEVQAALQQLGYKNTTMVRVLSDVPIMSGDAKELLGNIRKVPLNSSLTRYVGGATAAFQDAISSMYKDFPKAVALIVIATYLALLIMFRSVVLPLKAVIMNTFSIGASFGALVFIFQEGHLQNILNFRADGSIESTIPIILFSILFGLSMDYEVFLLSRIKEEHDAGSDNTTSVALGLERSGRIITSAALILVLVAGSFATGDIIIIKVLGFGLALAILIDATVVRALLVPSLMRLLGDANWWAPAFLKKVLPAWETEK